MKKAIIVGALPLEDVSFLNKAREEGFFLSPVTADKNLL